MSPANTERTGWGSIQYGDNQFLVYSYIPPGMNSTQSEPGAPEAAPAAETRKSCRFWDQFESCLA